jgi:hypothetical protein
MSNFNWIKKEIFDLSPIQQIIFLQRKKDTDNLEEEFAPFLNLPTLFQEGTLANPKSPVKGILESIEILGSAPFLLLKYKNSSGSYKWGTKDIQTMTMTIWRVNKMLDTIQIAIIGKKENLYLQTGGKGLLSIISDETKLYKKGIIDDIVRLFRQCIPFENVDLAYVVKILSN